MPHIASPLAGKKRSQQISAIVLVLLALIALLAILAHGKSSPKVPSALPSISAPTTTAQVRASASTTKSAEGSSSSGGTVAYILLPIKAQNTITLILRGGPFPYTHDGIVYKNLNHALPTHPRGWYHEYTVETPGASNRAMRRIVTGRDNTFYYTSDHYNTFKRVLR